MRNYLWHKEDEEKASRFTWKGRQPPFTAGSSKGPPPNQPLHRRPHKRRRVRFRWGLVWIFKDSAEAKWHSSNTILWKSSAYNYINRLSEDGYCICCHCTRKMMQNLRSGPKSPEKFCFVTVSFCMFAGRMMISVQVSRFWFLSHLSLLLRLFLSGICPSSRLYTGEHVMVTIISLYCEAAEVSLFMFAFFLRNVTCWKSWTNLPITEHFLRDEGLKGYAFYCSIIIFAFEYKRSRHRPDRSSWNKRHVPGLLLTGG